MPARRSVRAALESMTQSFNRVISRALSPSAVKWRFEAWRTKRPFAEVVLAHTLVFRVERVMIVHRETGLLLREVAAPVVEAADGDVISCNWSLFGAASDEDTPPVSELPNTGSGTITPALPFGFAAAFLTLVGAATALYVASRLVRK